MKAQPPKESTAATSGTSAHRTAPQYAHRPEANSPCESAPTRQSPPYARQQQMFEWCFDQEGFPVKNHVRREERAARAAAQNAAATGIKPNRISVVKLAASPIVATPNKPPHWRAKLTIPAPAPLSASGMRDIAEYTISGSSPPLHPSKTMDSTRPSLPPVSTVNKTAPKAPLSNPQVPIN